MKKIKKNPKKVSKIRNYYILKKLIIIYLKFIKQLKQQKIFKIKIKILLKLEIKILENQ